MPNHLSLPLSLSPLVFQAHPDSAVAVNLKACNHFRLYNGRAAEAEIKVLADQVKKPGGNCCSTARAHSHAHTPVRTPPEFTARALARAGGQALAQACPSVCPLAD